MLNGAIERSEDHGTSVHVGAEGKGINLRGTPGSGLFWMNMLAGIGDQRTRPAGLPVQAGTRSA